MKIRLVYEAHEIGTLLIEKMPTPRPGDYLSIHADTNDPSRTMLFVIVKVNYHFEMTYYNTEKRKMVGSEQDITLDIHPANALAQEHTVERIRKNMNNEADNL